MGLAFLVDGIRDWWDRRTAMTELRRLKRNDEPYKKAESAALLGAVKSAAFREDPEGTVRAYEALRTHWPDLAISSFTAIRALIAVGEDDRAKCAIKEGLRRFPRSRDLMAFNADMAQKRRDWLEAIRLWQEVRSSFPNYFWAWFWPGVALKEIGRLDEAEQLFEHAAKLEPSNPLPAEGYAAIGEQRGDLEEALRRWNLMRDRIEDQGGWVGTARVLCRLGRANEAIELLEAARWRFQSRPEPLLELVEVCEREGATEDALRHYQGLRDAFPMKEQGFVGAARVLRRQGRSAEADALLQSYVSREDAAPGAVVEWAINAQQNDSREAVRRWNIVRERFPDRTEGYTQGAMALDAIGEILEANHVRAQLYAKNPSSFKDHTTVERDTSEKSD
jgi:tetratricopeptide (TPR) repeat protein